MIEKVAVGDAGRRTRPDSAALAITAERPVNGTSDVLAGRLPRLPPDVRIRTRLTGGDAPETWGW